MNFGWGLVSYLTIGEASFDNFGREAPHHEAMSTLGHFRRVQRGLSAGKMSAERNQAARPAAEGGA